MAPNNSAAHEAETTLRALCLGYPGAYEDHPWGDTVFKVKGKVFVFMGTGKIGFGISAKLPVSSAVALLLPFASPTGYGLGKSGWVSAEFSAKDEIPLDMLSAWIDESYRAVAPKKMVAELAARGAGATGAKDGPAAAGAADAKPAKKAAKKPAASASATAPATKAVTKVPATKAAAVAAKKPAAKAKALAAKAKAAVAKAVAAKKPAPAAAKKPAAKAKAAR